MTLDKIYLKLQVNLFTPFVFYIPSSIVPEDKKQALEIPALKAVIDQILLIEESGSDYRVVSAKSLFPILSKAAVLDKNMFLLLKQKKKLSSSEFGFLLDKYKESLNFFVVVSERMSKNIHTLNNTLSKEVAFHFETQHKAFQKHELAFQKYFFGSNVPVFKKIDWSKVIANELATLAPSEVKNELQSILIADKKPTAKKEKKAPLLTDEQSQRYLLETVFNVKFD